MNIFLVPHTWARHVAVGLFVAGAGLVTWWLLLALQVVVLPAIGFMLSPGWDGPLYLGLGGGAIAFTSVLAEQSLRRQPVLQRTMLPVAAGLVSFMATMISYLMLQAIHGALASESMAPLVTDPGYSSLRYRVLQWCAAGVMSGFGPAAVRVISTRSLRGLFDHVAGGLASGLMGAAFWHFFSYYGVPFLDLSDDLYLGPAMGLFGWGLAHGMLVWGIPSELYAGWVRVLSPHRFGHRIPVDRIDGKAAERFVGHFPRGLDMYLPADKGVAELHVSFVADGQGEYAVRGLSQAPILLKRPLERVDLRYDPRRPAPLQTELRMEDRVFLGQGDAQTELEFLLLPKEET